mgnify:CR=1 FL=1
MKDFIFKWYALLFAKPVFERFNLLLMHLSLRGLGILNHQTHKLSGEQFFINYIFQNYSIKTIFDVGANVGNYTQLFADKQCQIYCFEPHPNNYPSLQNRYKDYSNINTFNIGISNTQTTAKIYDYEDNFGSPHASIFQEVITTVHANKARSADIKLDTLDNILAAESVSHIDLLKLDIEGNELSALQGAKSALAKNTIDIIQIEFTVINIISRSFFNDFVAILPQYNFYRLLPNAFLPIDNSNKTPLQNELFAFQNIVAIRKAIDKNS